MERGIEARDLVAGHEHRPPGERPADQRSPEATVGRIEIGFAAALRGGDHALDLGADRSAQLGRATPELPQIPGAAEQLAVHHRHVAPQTLDLLQIEAARHPRIPFVREHDRARRQRLEQVARHVFHRGTGRRHPARQLDREYEEDQRPARRGEPCAAEPARGPGQARRDQEPHAQHGDEEVRADVGDAVAAREPYRGHEQKQRECAESRRPGEERDQADHGERQAEIPQVGRQAAEEETPLRQKRVRVAEQPATVVDRREHAREARPGVRRIPIEARPLSRAQRQIEIRREPEEKPWRDPRELAPAPREPAAPCPQGEKRRSEQEGRHVRGEAEAQRDGEGGAVLPTPGEAQEPAGAERQQERVERIHLEALGLIPP